MREWGVGSGKDRERQKKIKDIFLFKEQPNLF
jgi:hypothetical protein